MILNGKAKEDFKNWCKEDEDNVLDSMNIIYLYALIVSWFDNETDVEIPRLIWTKWSNNNDVTYLGATEKAIEKANEIYNARY